jgi:hypothetical protein
MSSTVVHYKTKPERADENQALIEAVFAELAETAPAGLTYESYRLADGVSFVHVASIDTDGGSNPLTSAPAFATFLQDIADRCAEPPIASGANKIGSYVAGTPVAGA